MSIAMDGTYKLLINGYVLIIMATHSVNPTNRADDSFTHTGIPFLFCLSRSEGQPVFDMMLSTLTKLAGVDFFNIQNFSVLSGSMDRCPAILNAYVKFSQQKEGRDMKFVNCYAHLVRNAKKHAKLLKNQVKYYISIFIY